METESKEYNNLVPALQFGFTVDGEGSATCILRGSHSTWQAYRIGQSREAALVQVIVVSQAFQWHRW